MKTCFSFSVITSYVPQQVRASHAEADKETFRKKYVTGE
jgi:hypothetical protein